MRFCCSVLIGLWSWLGVSLLPRPAAADWLDREQADLVRRGDLGILEGEPLSYRVLRARHLDSRGRQGWIVEVFFTDRRAEFDSLPRQDSVAADPGARLPGLSRDDLDVVFSKGEMAGFPAVPVYDPKAGILKVSVRSSFDGRSAFRTEVARWRRDRRVFEKAYETREVPAFRQWSRLLRDADRSRREALELRLLVTQPTRDFYYGPNCDSAAGAVLFEGTRKLVDVALARGDERRAHRLLSAVMRYRTSYAPPADIAMPSLPAAPLCGAVFDLSKVPAGYGQGPAVFADGAEVASCARERVTAKGSRCLEGRVEKSWSGREVSTAILDYAELVAARGDEELALWLTFMMPTAGRDDRARPEYDFEIELGAEPREPVASERVEEVVDFADRQHRAGRHRLGALYDRRLLRAHSHLAADASLPARVQQRAARYPAVKRSVSATPPALAAEVAELVAAGRVLEATGLLLLEFTPLVERLQRERRQEGPSQRFQRLELDR